MKTVTIGRGADNQIILYDERTSRRHALLKIYVSGKMELIDVSTNGTFVNGMKVPKNKPYPVTRKNTVTFAHADRLNWSDVPDNYRSMRLSAGFAAAVVCMLVLFFVLKPIFFSDEPTPIVYEPEETTEISAKESSGAKQDKESEACKDDNSVDNMSQTPQIVFPNNNHAVTAGRREGPPAKKTKNPVDSNKSANEDTASNFVLSY